MSNGVTLPRVIKHIMCNPPAPLKLVEATAVIKESLGLVNDEIMS